MGSSGRRHLFRIAGVLIGLTIFFVFVELALRVVDWPAPGLYVGGRGPMALSMPNEEGSSWRAHPGPARLRHWDYDVEIELNTQGFIERERAPKSPGTWRIGVFGDSFTAGMGVPATKRFTQVWLESISRRAGGRAIEVYNFGSAWCGSAQNAAFLARHADAWQLDEVVLAVFGGNELEDNIRWYDYAALSPEEQRRADAAASSGNTLRDWVRNHSRAAGFLYVTIAGRFSKKIVPVLDADAIEAAWPATGRALDDFAEASGGRPLTLWYLPDGHEWDDSVWQSVRSEHGLEDGERHGVRDAIARWSRDHALPFIDATPFLAGRSIADLRFPRDGHWNEAGHRLVGEALAATPGASRIQVLFDESPRDDPSR